MNVLLSSNKADWETPQKFYDVLQREFDFDLDAASHEMNAKLPQYLTEDDNALICAWPGKRAFCNPPYTRGNSVGRWMRKMATEYTKPKRDLIVALVAARTDTAWFHDIAMALADEIRFVRGRLLFEVNGKPVMRADRFGNMRPQPATFPSTIIVFRRKPLLRIDNRPLIRSMSTAGVVIGDDDVPI